jgi:hypothetical protein
MQKYGIGQFLAWAMEKNITDIIFEAGREGKQAERSRDLELLGCLHGLVFLLEHQMSPGGITEQEFQSFRPLCDALVGKGQLDASVLNLFANSKQLKIEGT